MLTFSIRKSESPTLELLEKLKVNVVYPFDQTCCGQPMANSGCYEEAQATEELFIKNFCAFDHIVTPSGSCTHHLRNKFTAAPDSPERRKILHQREISPRCPEVA